MKTEQLLIESEKANGYAVYCKGSEKYNAFNEGFKTGAEYVEKNIWNDITKIVHEPERKLFVLTTDGVPSIINSMYLQGLEQMFTHYMEVPSLTPAKDGMKEGG